MTATLEPLHSQRLRGTHRPLAVQDTTSPRAKGDTSPTEATLAGTQLPDPTTHTPMPNAGASGQEPTSGSSQDCLDTQSESAAAGTNFPTGQVCLDTHGTSACGGTHSTEGHADDDTHSTSALGGFLFSPFLRLAAEVVDDAEATMLANQNRLRQLTRVGFDKDGKERGFGLDESHPDVARLAALVKMLEGIDHQAALNLGRLLRAHPLGPWLKTITGAGDKQTARLLAVIGDPYWHGTQGRPRLVSELWQYAGHGDPAKRRAKGMTQADLFALGSPTAKSRTWLIASKFIMFDGKPDKNGNARPRSIYRDVYDDRKAATVGRLHARDCVRCGPSGHPALTGTAWSDAHRHADALRIVGKAFLRDLWLEAKRLHDEADPTTSGSSQTCYDTHIGAAAAGSHSPAGEHVVCRTCGQSGIEPGA